jgi:hypothetical protein
VADQNAACDQTHNHRNRNQQPAPMLQGMAERTNEVTAVKVCNDGDG